MNPQTTPRRVVGMKLLANRRKTWLSRRMGPAVLGAAITSTGWLIAIPSIGCSDQLTGAVALACMALGAAIPLLAELVLRLTCGIRDDEEPAWRELAAQSHGRAVVWCVLLSASLPLAATLWSGALILRIRQRLTHYP